MSDTSTSDTDHPDWDDLTLLEKVRAAVGSGLVSAGYLTFPSKFDESLQRQEFEYAADELGAEIRYVDTGTDQ